MKSLILLALLGVAYTADLNHFHFGRQLDVGQTIDQGTIINGNGGNGGNGGGVAAALGEDVIADEREGPVGANFRYRLETADGTVIEQSGTEGAEGTAAVSGSYQFVAPDGQTIQVTYVADENGFRAESPILPEIPAHAQQQIEFAAQQRAAGVTFDDGSGAAPPPPANGGAEIILDQSAGQPAPAPIDTAAPPTDINSQLVDNIQPAPANGGDLITGRSFSRSFNRPQQNGFFLDPQLRFVPHRPNAFIN